jgi:CheY-like chemotaxis protein
MEKQILVIDDSKAIRFLLQTVLSNQYNVVSAADGFSGMYWLSKRNRPELIIIDPLMQGIKHWDIIDQLKSSGLHGDIPVIVLSSLGYEETKEKCQELGVEAFFSKPFNPLEIVKTIKEILSKKKVLESANLAI